MKFTITFLKQFGLTVEDFNTALEIAYNRLLDSYGDKVYRLIRKNDPSYFSWHIDPGDIHNKSKYPSRLWFEATTHTRAYLYTTRDPEKEIKTREDRCSQILTSLRRGTKNIRTLSIDTKISGTNLKPILIQLLNEQKIGAKKVVKSRTTSLHYYLLR